MFASDSDTISRKTVWIHDELFRSVNGIIVDVATLTIGISCLLIAVVIVTFQIGTRIRNCGSEFLVIANLFDGKISFVHLPCGLE